MKKLTIKDIQKLAKKRGGQCLSTTYINGESKLIWQCSAGHKWQTTPRAIRNGRWCHSCAIKKGTIQEMQALAARRGGQCLSPTYRDNASKLLWQCAKRHQWEAASHNIKQGTWCPACAGRKKGTIEEMQALAARRGGKCLSTTYTNGDTKLTWECSAGHQWQTTPANVKNHKHWCATCASKKGTIAQMQALAATRGGQCLSPLYIDHHSKLLWECHQGHQWEASPNSLKKGSWCPTCAGKKKGTIQEMQALAARRGGKCLSTTYTNNKSHLLWVCKEGHKWHAKPTVITRGQWCPVCRRHTYDTPHKRYNLFKI